MTDHQKQQLLDALMYYLPMDVRRKISRELPEAYAAYCNVKRTALAMATAERERIKTTA